MKFSNLESLGICDGGKEASQYLTTSVSIPKLGESKGKKREKRREEGVGTY